MSASFPIRWFFLFLAALAYAWAGCSSSVQSSGGPVVTGDPDSGLIPDASDDRLLPETCSTPEDCNDGDPCTTESCVNGKCEFAFRDVALEPTSLATAGPARDVAFAGDTLYVAEADAGVEAFDITDPGSPQHIGQCATEGEALAVDANSTYIIVAEGADGLELFSAAPELTLMGHVEPGSGVLSGMDTASNVDIGPTRIMVPVYTDGALLLDMSDPANPVDLGDVDTPGRSVAASSNGQAGLVADSLGGATAIVFDSGDGPAEGGTMVTDGRMLDVAVIVQTAALAEYGPGFSVVDFSDPTFPERLAYIPTSSPGVAVALIGQQTLVAAEESGRVAIYDLRRATPPGPLQPSRAAEWTAETTPVRIAASNGLVAVALDESGVVLLRTGCEL